MENTYNYLEPLKYYELELKEKHKENVESFFEELSKNSKVDIEGNKQTCHKYYAENSLLDKFKSSLSATKAGIVFMIILMIVGFALGLILLIVGFANQNYALVGVGAGLIVVGVIALIVYLKVFKDKKKALEKKINDKQKVVDELKKEAYGQMTPLNGAFNVKMVTDIIHKTAPLIEFDDKLTSKVEERVVKQFKDKLDTEDTHSSLVVQSGNINKNPFILRQKLEMNMKPETYTGTLLITYTKYVSDGNGGTKAVTVTQTLVATVVKPKPHYSVATTLTYYSDAASNLSFYRTPAHLEGKSDKQIERATRKEERENSRKAESATKKGGNYTKFANSKFEAYINSEGRDNEVEYRVLFTPVAQNNFVYTFSKRDDIFFTKTKCVNTISSLHDMNMDYSGDISNYMHFDYEVIKKNFINYNVNYFEGLYYDLIPILNIPVYHQNQSAPFVESTEQEQFIGYYESECLVNKFEPNLFKPKECATDVILKPTVAGNTLVVTAHGYKAVLKTEFVPTIGGDGILHPVPVDYYEYFPVTKNTKVEVFDKSIKNDGNNKDIIINYKQYSAKLCK